MPNTKDLKTTTQIGTITGHPPIIVPPQLSGKTPTTNNQDLSVSGEKPIIVYNPPITTPGR